MKWIEHDASRMTPDYSQSEEDAQVYRDTDSIVFPKMDDRQLALLERLGRRWTLRCGERVFRAGQSDLGMTGIQL